MRDKAQKKQKKNRYHIFCIRRGYIFFLFTSQMIPMNGIPFEKYKYPKANRYSLWPNVKCVFMRSFAPSYYTAYCAPTCRIRWDNFELFRDFTEQQQKEKKIQQSHVVECWTQVLVRLKYVLSGTKCWCFFSLSHSQLYNDGVMPTRVISSWTENKILLTSNGWNMIDYLNRELVKPRNSLTHQPKKKLFFPTPQIFLLLLFFLTNFIRLFGVYVLRCASW